MFEDKKILIVKYSSLGDIVNAVPAVRFLKESCPKAHLYWLVRREYADILSSAAFIDGTIVLGAGRKAFFDAVRKLRSMNIDVAIDLQGLFKSGLIGYLSGAGTRVSFPHAREGSSIFYTGKMGSDRKGLHAALENMSVVEEFTGKKAGGHYNFDLSLNGKAPEVDVLLAGVNGKRVFVVISPTSRWQTKMWMAEKFARLADMIADKRGTGVVFTGTKGDSQRIESIRAMMKNPSLDLSEKTDIRTLATVFKKARLVVSCDSGAMHLASAIGVPLVAIFGPTDPHYTGPFCRNSIVISAGVDCSPCRKRACRHLTCMAEITPEMVFDHTMKIPGGWL